MKNNKEKKRLRSLKRDLKRDGNKKVRRDAKKIIVEDPEEAHLINDTYGASSTQKMNGMDHDATRNQIKS